MNKVQGLAPFCIFQPKVREQKSLNHSSVPLHEFLESSILHPWTPRPYSLLLVIVSDLKLFSDVW